MSGYFWLIMRRSSSRPQQLREQLLHAIDEQNNIHNMAAVVDVIYCLEKYPMTKEALIETRLGKLINDVRRKSTDEDLVTRLKRLVRSWQRLIGENGATEKELSCSAVTANLIQDKFISRSTQTFGNLSYSNVNRRVERCDDSASGKSISSHKRSKIPIRAINPYSSSLISAKQSSALTRRNQTTSLSSQPSQNHQDGRHMQMSKIHSAFDSQKNLLSTSSASHVPSSSSIQESHMNAEQLSDFMNNHTLRNNPAEVSNGVKEPTIKTFGNKTQHSSFTSKHTEDNTKPTQLNGSNITYDHHTKQIKLISYKTSNPREDRQRTAESAAQGSEDQETNTTVVPDSSVSSQRKFIEPVLSSQNSLTTESQTSKMNLNLVENIKQWDDGAKECRKTNVYPDFGMTELSGISRECTEKDLYRLHHEQWHGVNGCYDNRKNWYDWTQSIKLDSYGSPLKISPYVCIDYRL